MNNLNRLQKLLKSIDKNKTYFNVHAVDIFGSVFLIILAFLVFTYIAAKRNLIQIRKEWQKNKCKPEYSALAGFINAPPGSNMDAKLKYTSENYTACNVGILETNMNAFTQPLMNAQGLLKMMFEMAKKQLANVMIIFNVLKQRFLQVIQQIFAKIYQILIELQAVFFKIKDTFMKASGVLQASFLFLVGQAFVFITFLNSLIEVCTIILIILTVFIILCFVIAAIVWIIGLSAPFITIAFTLLTIYLGMAIPMILLIIVLAAVNSFLAKQEMMTCFHPDTKIKLANGEYKCMKDLDLGEKLDKNIDVIAVLRIKGEEKDKFYKIYSKELNDYIFVTGTHLIKDPKTKKFIKVADFKDANITETWVNEMSCLVTSNHHIPIGEYTFYDWED